MQAFAILETNVIACPSIQQAKDAIAHADGDPRVLITSEADLIASPVSVGQLVEIWNGFAGVVPFDDLKPVKKFTDRKTAVSRTWKAIQRLAAPAAAETAAVGEQGAQDAPEQPEPTKEASPDKGAPGGRKRAKGGVKAAPKKAAQKEARPASKKASKPKQAAGAREGSKKAQVLDLIRRPGGATLETLMKATGWQTHSVRGFISGGLGKKMGLKVESFKAPDGGRTYRLPAH